MKSILIVSAFCLLSTFSNAHLDSLQTERNKAIARAFYEDLWFSNNTHNYSRYVADNYVVHDIGDRKGITEPAIEQKNIADFLLETW